MQKELSEEDIFNNFKTLVLKYNDDSKENLYSLFKLAVTFNDYDTIKILAKEYYLIDAILFLKNFTQDNTSSNLIDLIVNDADYITIKNTIIQGVYVNKKDKNGNTALIHASLLNKVDIVKLLLENGADINDKFNNEIKLVELVFQLGFKEVLELLISNGAHDILEEYASSFFSDVDKRITSRFIAEQFVYEELDAARQGNDEAKHFVNKSGIKKELFTNAMSESLPEVDGAESPQQVLVFKCLMSIMNSDNRDLVTKVRILTVEKIMSKYYLGKYENKITKLILENSVSIHIQKDFALIEDERFEIIDERKKDKFYNRKRKIYLNIIHNAVVFSQQSYDGESKKDYFAISSQEEILKYDIQHNPKRLIEILNYFTKDNPIKYTAHSFDWNRYGTYEKFINEVKLTFEELEDDLKYLSPNLYEKITKFLFADNLSSNNTWGFNRIGFGWSSPELKEWAYREESKQDGKKAIYFPLEEKYVQQINGKTITTFEDVCNVFKNEIEIRDDDKLSMLLEELEEEILGFDFEVEYINLENISFYTDVEYLKNGLTKIFEQFKDETRKEYNHILIEAISCEEGNYTDLFITQINSSTKKDSNTMMKEIDNGDFQDIRKTFLSLCDWSIIGKFKDGFFKIDYLSLENENVIKEEINSIPSGFTHKLRFYNA